MGDITYLRTREGWLYLAAVLDIYSRKVVGWAMDKHMEQDLVSSALRMATTHRRPGEGVLHHSDRGSQYAAHDYQQLLDAHKMTVSMSRKGDCYDNAVMESFWATLKAECATEVYTSRQEARQSIFEYIEVWYGTIGSAATRPLVTQAHKHSKRSISNRIASHLNRGNSR